MWVVCCLAQAHCLWLCPAFARYLADGSTAGDHAAESHFGAFFGAVFTYIYVPILR